MQHDIFQLGKLKHERESCWGNKSGREKLLKLKDSVGYQLAMSKVTLEIKHQRGVLREQISSRSEQDIHFCSIGPLNFMLSECCQLVCKGVQQRIKK